jgi:hypothetical protein
VRAWAAVHLQGLLRQGQPQLGSDGARAGRRRRSADTLGSAPPDRRPGAHRRPSRGGHRRRCGRRRCPADARLPLPADRLHPGRRRCRQAGEHQEGAVSGARRHAQRGRQGPRCAAAGADTIMVCERGASFGYNNLVSDMRSLAIMRDSAARSSSTPPIRCSCRAARGAFPVASASSSRCWRERRWRWGLPGCSWKRIPVRKRHSPTGRTVGRWRAWRAC